MRVQVKYWIVPKRAEPPSEARQFLADPKNVGRPNDSDSTKFWIVDPTFPELKLPRGTCEVTV
eukprot:10098551-Lingulodinium_polyedra.AAC.1